VKTISSIASSSLKSASIRSRPADGRIHDPGVALGFLALVTAPAGEGDK